MKRPYTFMLTANERLETIQAIDTKQAIYSDNGQVCSYLFKLANEARVVIDSKTGEFIDYDNHATDIDTQLINFADSEERAKQWA